MITHNLGSPFIQIKLLLNMETRHSLIHVLVGHWAQQAKMFVCLRSLTSTTSWWVVLTTLSETINMWPPDCIIFIEFDFKMVIFTNTFGKALFKQHFTIVLQALVLVLARHWKFLKSCLARKIYFYKDIRKLKFHNWLAPSRRFYSSKGRHIRLERVKELNS